MHAFNTLLSLAASASAAILWDGRLNAYQSSAFLEEWDWSNLVGRINTTFMGIQITIDNSSIWNSDNMLRTELIPQTSAAINQGVVYYHFSMQHTRMHPPSPYEEHQVCFFESHFTEMKYGLISGEQASKDRKLQWMANGVSYWSTIFRPRIWHNIAYGIDFDVGSVTFYHSTGSADLKKVAGPVQVSVSSNGADWHLGILRLPSSTGRSDTAPEDWHFSGVYIEHGTLTKQIAG